MKRSHVIVASAAIAATAMAIPAIALLGGRPSSDRPREDSGRGELLIVLTAGTFPTAESAAQANERFAFSEVEGFQVAKSGDFEAMTPGRYVLVTAFRTVAGAEAFMPLAAAAGAKVERIVTRYTGTQYIGLGQEAHPDGTGPLNGPLPPGHPSRIG